MKQFPYWGHTLGDTAWSLSPRRPGAPDPCTLVSNPRQWTSSIYLSRSISSDLLVRLSIFLQATSSFTVNHFLFKIPVLRILISEVSEYTFDIISNTIQREFWLIFFPIPIIFHTPASNHPTPIRSFLLQQSTHISDGPVIEFRWGIFRTRSDRP